MLSGRHAEGNILQHWLTGVISEGHIIKGDVSFEVCRFYGVRGVVNVRLKVHDIRDPAPRYRSTADAAGKFGQIANRRVHAVHVRGKYQDVSRRHLPSE